MKRRKDYYRFKEILDRYQIKKFYHFTDRANIESIVKNGGLYSWGDCIKKSIYIAHPGGSELSHNLDLNEELQDYVRISVCKRHPMMYYAMQDGRIMNPVILEIDTDILYLEGNIFSDKNAVREDAKKGSLFSDFENIHFQSALKDTQFDVDDKEKDYFQAEILVKNHIPINYILNISDFVEHDKDSREICVKPPYSASITEENPTAIFFIINQSFSTREKIKYNGKEDTISQVMSDIINQQLHLLLLQNTENNNICNRYHVSVTGYGDYAYNCFNGNLRYKNIVKLSELKDNILSYKKINKIKKTRQGIIQIECDEPVWIKPQSDGNTILYKALNRVKHLVAEWISLHPSSFPPVIIHISDSEYSVIDNRDIIQIANEIKSLYTQDGNVIFANIILFRNLDEKSFLFPESFMDTDKSEVSEIYYLMSSQLPMSYNHQIEKFRTFKDEETLHAALAIKAQINDIPALLQVLINNNS